MDEVTVVQSAQAVLEAVVGSTGTVVVLVVLAQSPQVSAEAVLDRTDEVKRAVAKMAELDFPIILI